MKKKGRIPVTRVKNPEPDIDDPDWVIWAAWADRITFEEIEKKTGKTESEVIKIMRRSIKPASFRLWRKSSNHQKFYIACISLAAFKFVINLRDKIIFKVFIFDN